jgi:hypothetical protein
VGHSNAVQHGGEPRAVGGLPTGQRCGQRLGDAIALLTRPTEDLPPVVAEPMHVLAFDGLRLSMPAPLRALAKTPSALGPQGLPLLTVPSPTWWRWTTEKSWIGRFTPRPGT